MLLPVLVLLISVLLTVGWMTPAHGEETTSDQSSKGISIEYDSPSTIHKVGNVILFCMNNEMHWPHDTDTFKAPLYEEGYLTRENFQEKTGKTDTDYDTFIQELSVLLYAGYPYNGLGLFPIEGNGGSGSISEDAFRQLLIPSERLRSDFPELSKTEAGKPVEDQATLKAFMNAVFNNYYNTSEVTASGMKYSDITETAFYKAAFCVVNSADPREAYTRIYLNESPYESTSNAIWQLMDEYGIPLKHVIRHYDVTGKICPNPYVRNNRTKTSWTWDEFKARLAEYRRSGGYTTGKAANALPAETISYYRVRADWADTQSQIGAYTVLDNAVAAAKQHPGTCVYDWNGKQVYPAEKQEQEVFQPFTVRVSITDLNIRTGAGTGYARVRYIPIGVYTIVEIKAGKGSKAGWGRLKSGAGWISLDYAQRV